MKKKPETQTTHVTHTWAQWHDHDGYSPHLNTSSVLCCSCAPSTTALVTPPSHFFVCCPLKPLAADACGTGTPATVTRTPPSLRCVAPPPCTHAHHDRRQLIPAAIRNCIPQCEAQCTLACPVLRGTLAQRSSSA